MKFRTLCTRLCALALLLCLLVGLLPMGAMAAPSSTYDGNPTADVVQVVIDYGKTVDVAMSEVKAGIHLNRKGSVGSLVGFAATGSSGQLLAAAPSMTCNAVGQTLTTTHGSALWKDTSTVSYTPTGILSEIDYFYAVYALTGSSHAYILVEIEIIPASMIYYEAEDLTGSDLSTVDVTEGSSSAWEPRSEGNSANDNQGYDNIDIVPGMTIDRKHISGNSFFVDFDNTGNTNRYSKDPLYKNNYFDTANCWFAYSTLNATTVTLTPGYLSMDLVNNTNNHHYVQTRTSGGDATSSPLAIRPGYYDYFQARFRVEGIEKPTNPDLRICFATASGSNVNTNSGKHINHHLDPEAVYSGEYITATIPLNTLELYYTADMIYSIQFRISNIVEKAGATGKIYIDYIYIGPSQGLMTPKLPSENGTGYLFFGFDSSSQDPRYTNTIYGSSSNNRDYHASSSWSIDGASNSKAISTTFPGYLRIKDKVKWDSSDPNDKWYYYNAVHTGANWETDTLGYNPGVNDVFIIRFKISGGKKIKGYTGYGDGTFIRVEGKARNGTAGDDGDAVEWGHADFSLAKAQAGYIQVTVQLNTTAWKNLANAASGNASKVGSIRPTFYNVDFNGDTPPTYYIDYMYLGPSNLAPANLDGADPIKDASYLFIDYNNAANDKLRYCSRAFGHINRDLAASCSPNGCTLSVTGGKMVMTDATPSGQNASGTADGDNSSRLYFWNRDLRFTPGANHHVQMRLRIDPAVSGGSVTYTSVDGSTGKPWVDFYFKNSADGGGYVPTADRHFLNLSTDVGKWLTVTIPINHSAYNTGNKIVSIVPAVRGTQGAKVTIDYIYLGPRVYNAAGEAFNPMQASNPANKALYFGFDNSNSGRYTKDNYNANDTYNGANYDTGSWTIGGNGSGATFHAANGTMSVPLTTASTAGPIVTAGTLKYHPNLSDVLQARFRLNGCTVAPNGNPRLTAKITGYLNGTSKTHTISKPFADTNNFQSITLPMERELLQFTTVTKLELQFCDIQGGTLEIDHIYLGDGTVTPFPVYGQDNAYNNDTLLSDGASLFVKGNGSRIDPTAAELENGSYVDPKKYTEATFSFTGTGFDLISRTGKDQGTIRVGVYTDERMTKESCVKSITVNSFGDLELYQIPVVSVQGLDHGKYYVRIGVNVGLNLPQLGIYMGNEFYLDGIRIYDPINVKGSTLNAQQQAALDAYRAHKEAYAYIKEIRDSLLSVADFNAALLGNGTGGALFVDSNVVYDVPDETLEVPEVTQATTEAPETEGDHRVVTAADYTSIGPKNEVYLAPGQAIAFKLEKDTAENPVSIDIGAKTVLRDGAVLSAGFVTAVDDNTLTTVSSTKWTVNSASAQYFALDETKLSTGTAVYLVIYNAHTGTDKTKNILSVTDLKVCYAKTPTRTDLPQDGTNSLDSTIPQATRAMRAEAEPYGFAVDGRTLEAAEVYLNGTVMTPIEGAPTLNGEVPIYHSLNLASDISVNYIVPQADLEGYDSFRMEVHIPVYEGNELMDYRMEILEPVEKDGYYYFTLYGLTAIHMNDVLEATVHMTKGDSDVYSPTDFYSIADYAYGQLAKDTVTDSLKTLCGDLLVYGGRAQVFKGYRTDALADMLLTEEQKAYCSDLEAVTFGSNNYQLSDCENASVAWVGKTLNLGTKVSLLFVLDPTAYEGGVEELCLKLRYTDLQGEEKTAVVTEKTPYGGYPGAYAFAFEGLNAAELRSVLTVGVYAGEEQVSNSLVYSMDTYGNGKTGDLGEVCKALFAYSDSALAFFRAG